MKTRSFKSLALAAVALAVTAFTFAPSSAKADHRYAGNCGSCGASLQQQAVFTGCYDHCGRPIYRWVTVAHNCRSSHSSHYGSSHGSNYGYGYGYRSYNSYPRPSYSFPRSGFSISISRGHSHSHCR